MKTGGQVSIKKFDQFVKKKVQFLFIDINDKKSFESWSSENRDQQKVTLVEKIGAGHEQVINFHIELRDELLNFLTAEITNSGVKVLVEKTREFITEFKKKDKNSATKILAKILKYSESIADHSMNVANLSLYLAYSLGYSSQGELEKIYIGAMLHDYGKVIVDLDAIDPKRLPQKYITELKRHPEVGRVSLLMESGIPNESISIIHEHHERFDGTGYPKGIKGFEINSYSKIVAIANYFDNIVTEGKGSLELRQINALNKLSNDDAAYFDPETLKKSIEHLKTVIRDV